MRFVPAAPRLSAHDVARVLRALLPHMGTVKMHKLLYYCQGIHLARFDRAMFRERIEAWTNGPVVAELWRAHKYDHEPPAPVDLTANDLEIVDFVVSQYGGYTGRQLIRKTHLEAPWIDASERDELADGNKEVSVESLTRYFRMLDSGPDDHDEDWREAVSYAAMVERYRQRAPHAYDLRPQPLSEEFAAMLQGMQDA